MFDVGFERDSLPPMEPISKTEAIWFKPTSTATPFSPLPAKGSPCLGEGLDVSGSLQTRLVVIVVRGRDEETTGLASSSPPPRCLMPYWHESCVSLSPYRSIRTVSERQGPVGEVDFHVVPLPPQPLLPSSPLRPPESSRRRLLSPPLALPVPNRRCWGAGPRGLRGPAK